MQARRESRLICKPRESECLTIEADQYIQILRLLADGHRLRLLAALAEHELSVAELALVLELKQPRVSTHLAKLREASLVSDRRDGVSVYYRWHGAQTALIERVLKDLPDRYFKADADRLRQVLLARQGSWADQVAGDMERHYSPGRTWEALARAFALTLDLGDVLDLASGDGAVAEVLASQSKTLTCVDVSARVLDAAAARLKQHPGVRITRADMHELPLEDTSFDTVLMLQALPFARSLERVLSEAKRVLRAGGKILGTSLLPHDAGDYVRAFGHLNSGFSLEQLRHCAQALALEVVKLEQSSVERKPPNFEIAHFVLRKHG